MRWKAPIRGRVEVVGPKGQALSHGYGRRGERLQVVLQRLQIFRQLTVDALHLDEEIVGALVHLLHTSVHLKGRRGRMEKGEGRRGRGGGRRRKGMRRKGMRKGMRRKGMRRKGRGAEEDGGGEN